MTVQCVWNEEIQIAELCRRLLVSATRVLAEMAKAA